MHRYHDQAHVSKGLRCCRIYPARRIPYNSTQNLTRLRKEQFLFLCIHQKRTIIPGLLLPSTATFVTRPSCGREIAPRPEIYKNMIRCNKLQSFSPKKYHPVETLFVTTGISEMTLPQRVVGNAEKYF